MLYRLLCTYAPSQLLMVVIAGIGTFIGGLKFVVMFCVAVALIHLGSYLDHYGQGTVHDK